MTTLLLSLIPAGLAAALLIVATHLLLWRPGWRLSRLQAYCVGVAEIGAVLTAWALAMGYPEAVIGFWGIAGAAGAADLIAWWVRTRLRRIAADTQARAFARGQIVGLDVAAADYGDGDGED